MKLYLPILLIACLQLNIALAQKDQGTVQGKIKDKENGALIPFAVFLLVQDTLIKYKTETDFNGNFKMSSITPGVYNVKVAAEGFNSKQINGFLVKEKTINFIDIELEKIIPVGKKKKRKH